MLLSFDRIDLPFHVLRMERESRIATALQSFLPWCCTKTRVHPMFMPLKPQLERRILLCENRVEVVEIGERIAFV